MNNNILETINHIKINSKYKNPIYVYTHGKCLEFAENLKKIYPNGTILYLPDMMHFVFKYENKIYDISGNVSKIYKGERVMSYEEVSKRKK